MLAVMLDDQHGENLRLLAASHAVIVSVLPTRSGADASIVPTASL